MSTERGYQESGRDKLRLSFSRGNRKVLWWMPTGTGKTFCFIHLTKRLVDNKKRVIIVMRRRELIFQTQKSIEKFTGLKCSVIMGSEKGFDPTSNIQVCSIDTISRRIDTPTYQFLLDFDFIIIDEAHDTTSPRYLKFMDKFPKHLMAGFTATPFPTGKKYLEHWDDIISPINAVQARDSGFLVPEKTFAPAKIDVSGIRTKGADFDQKELAVRASESAIVGDIVDTWRKYGDNRPTILFAVNKDHSAIMAEAFRQADIPAVHQDESHTSKEREHAINQLKRGDIKILCNVNIFSTGVDIPQASCGIFARPTKSEILYVQQVGRLLRPYKRCASCSSDCGAEPTCFECGSDKFSFQKDCAILLDHANNCERFGLAYSDRPAKIRPPEKRKKRTAECDVLLTRTCEKCFTVYEPKNKSCPVCGHQNELTEREIKQIEGELVRKREADLRYSRMIVIKNELMKLYAVEKRYNWKESAKWMKLFEQFGPEIFEFKEELEMPRWVKSTVSRLGAQSFINS